MRALALAVAAMAMTFGGIATVPLAHADGIERPRRDRPALRPRPRPAPPAEAPAPPVYREGPAVPLFTPAPPSNEIRLSDGFFNAPLAGGVGYGINSNAVGGGGGSFLLVSRSRFTVTMTRTFSGHSGSISRSCCP